MSTLVMQFVLCLVLYTAAAIGTDQCCLPLTCGGDNNAIKGSRGEPGLQGVAGETGTCECDLAQINKKLDVSYDYLKGEIADLKIANDRLNSELAAIRKTATTTLSTTSATTTQLSNELAVEQCSLGLKVGGELNDSAFTANSGKEGYAAHMGRLNTLRNMPASRGSWAPEWRDRTGAWLQVNLGSTKVIHRIVTQGRNGVDYWTGTFKMKAGNSEAELEYTQKNGADLIFIGNVDGNSYVFNHFNPAVEARYIRVYPLTWYDWPALRFDLLSC